MRVQPDEAIYFKLNSKIPGLGNNHVQTELDLTYKVDYFLCLFIYF